MTKTRFSPAACLALLIAMLPASMALGQANIDFDNAYNYREFRVDPPLNWDQGPDIFQLGIDVIDTSTGARPAGAVVGAKNLQTNEIFPLGVDGPVGFFSNIPYSVDRANGDWVIEVDSDIGKALALVPKFGTGPGTQAIPGVGNLAIAPGAQPIFSWDLPANLLSLNDGNINRIRARIYDSNGWWIYDGIVDDTVLTATEFTTPLNVITHNGAFIGQVFIEGLNPYNRSRTIKTFVVEDVGVGGEAVSNDPYFFRDNRQANSVGWRDGDVLSIGTFVDPHSSTYVHAENGGEIITLAQSQEADRRFEFSRSFDYDAGLTGAWTVVAWNGGVESIASTHVVGAAEMLPFVRNVRILPDFLTPTFEWDLPTASPPFDSVRIGLFDDETNDRLSVFGPNQDQLHEFLPANATIYTFESGVLEAGRKYVVRIQLVDTGNAGNGISRSLSFFNFTPIEDTSNRPVFLPTVDESGVYLFDFDVTAAVPVILDPLVAVGYEYAIGEGNPRFASVELPFVGDDTYDLVLFDDTGSELPAIQLSAGIPFDFTTVDPTGVDRFIILGIEESAMLDPSDVTAFMTTVTFVADGQFTGTMTPITSFVGTTGDLDGDGDVDRDDIDVILAARNQPATGPDDPRDLDGNGVINVLDTRKAVLLCTHPRCAVQ